MHFLPQMPLAFGGGAQRAEGVHSPIVGIINPRCAPRPTKMTTQHNLIGGTMNKNYRPHLALLAAALVTMMCGSVTNIEPSDERGAATCTVQDFEPLGSTYTCSYTCANGRSGEQTINHQGLLPDVVGMFCDLPDEDDNDNPTVPNPEPTATPTSTPPGPEPLDESHSSPLLTGDVSAC